jgi:sulfur carrier protein
MKQAPRLSWCGFYRLASMPGSHLWKKNCLARIRAVLPSRLALKLRLCQIAKPHMLFYLNGKTQECAADSTISELLEAMEWSGRRIAVEKNGEIVPRSLHASTLIHEGDRLEVVVAVGGG